jgi:two-component system sensor histidine kinase SenX3
LNAILWTVLVAAAIPVAAWLGYRYGSRAERRSPPTAPLVREPGAVEPEGQPSPGAGWRDRLDNLDIERALADLRLGVVVVRPDGSEAYRNNRAKEFATGRHGDALVEAALQRVVEGALLGLSLEESVEVYGPPARSLLVQASPTYEGGELRGAVGVIDDVTEVRHITRVRSDFVANVSHELRTPIGAMSVLAETIVGSEDPEVVDRLAGRMLREANRLADTIDDLLALSRLESGPIDDPETIDLLSVVTMAIERTTEAAQQRPVRVSLEGGPGGPVLVDGDQGQLVSAVANLIDNAVKYSDADGRVEVRVRAVTPSSPPEVDEETMVATRGRPRPHRPAPDQSDRWGPGDSLAELSVFDDGIGIPERDIDRIFERFYRVDTARSRDTGGTGLGLSIVRHVLLNHRGTIDVESVEGQGSTFTMRLPLSPAQAQVAGRAQLPVTEGEGSGGR